MENTTKPANTNAATPKATIKISETSRAIFRLLVRAEMETLKPWQQVEAYGLATALNEIGMFEDAKQLINDFEF